MNLVKKYWLCQIGGWGLFYVVTAIVSIGFSDSVMQDLLANLFFCLLALSLTHVFRNYLNTNHWKALPLEQLIWRVVIALFLIDFILSAFAYTYNTFIVPDPNMKGIYFFVYLVNIFLLLSLWALAYFVWSYIERNRRLQIEKLKMETAVKSLELKNIKSNLQPHFIFNSLNSIRALVDENPVKAREAITQLSNILRSSITADKTEMQSLSKELELVKDYLALEAVRFEERLHVKYDVAADTLDIQLPTLILQTIIENAIKHGIASAEHGGSIHLSSHRVQNNLIIVVENPGDMNEGKTLEQNSSGFGIQASRIRLQHQFGKQADILLENTNKQTVLTKIIIPLNELK